MKKAIYTALLISYASSMSAGQLAYSNESKTEQGDATITVRTLTKNEHPLVSKRLMKYYQPLEVEIKNSGPGNYVLDKEGFSLPITKRKRVASKYTNRLSPKHFLAGILLTPLLVITTSIAFLMAIGPGASPLFILLVGGIGGMQVIAPTITITIVAAVVATGIGIRSFRSRSKNKEDKIAFLSSHACDLEKPLNIPAHSTVKKVFYVPKSKYKAQFDIALKKVA